MINKKKTKSKTLLERFNEKKAKDNIENTLLKGGVDIVAGSIAGTGIAAIVGDKSPFVGMLLILVGHYYGDESGLLRVTGASTLAYGIAKAKDYQNKPELNSPSNRLQDLKSNVLTAFHLKWDNKSLEKNELKVPVKSKPPHSTS